MTDGGNTPTVIANRISVGTLERLPLNLSLDSAHLRYKH